MSWFQKRLQMLGAATLFGTGVVLSCDNKYRRQLAAETMPAQIAHFNRVQGPRKADLFHTLYGNVLELGPGTGSNFKYYPKNIMWSGVERNPEVISNLKKSAARHGFAPAALPVHQQDILGHLKSLPDASVGAIVSTLVLGTNDNHSDITEEIYRVLRPGGQFYFVERTASPVGVLRAVQWLCSPITRVLNFGVDPVGNVAQSIIRAGFQRDKIYCEQWDFSKHKENHRMGVSVLHVDNDDDADVTAGSYFIGTSGMRPLIAGVAIKTSELKTYRQRISDYDVFAFGTNPQKNMVNVFGQKGL